MKMIMISYNSAIESEVTEVLKNLSIQNFTKWTNVLGKGEKSGSHFGTEIWPGINSVIAIALEDNKKDEVIAQIRKLRTRFVKIGVKAFVWNLEETT